MAVYIDSSDRLLHDQAHSLALTCPHCLVLAHITPMAVPPFSELSLYRPRQIGIVYRCDACNSPIFLRFNVRSYGAQRIELSAQFTEIERPREKFTFTYLPEAIETLFREALLCYSHGAFNAFTSMCRRTMQTAFELLGEPGKLRLFDQLNELREMAQIDATSFTVLKRVIFGSDSDPGGGLPILEDDQAGILLEVMKDLLYQAYVRRGRLQQAMVVRRFFSDQTDRSGAAATYAATATASAGAGAGAASLSSAASGVRAADAAKNTI
ncbi:MAG TPA: hypothetical protein VKT19_03835 [Steroidobacteraceae bacterium]|nr:hypothetical protein [Steroidobacteraceae bacterium]